MKKINNHQQKAMYHIENTKKTKNAKKRRGKENKSMSNIFLSMVPFYPKGFDIHGLGGLYKSYVCHLMPKNVQRNDNHVLDLNADTIL